MKTIRAFLLLAVAGLLMAAGSIQYVEVGVAGPRHSGVIATKFIIYDTDPATTGYEVEISVCHPTEHGCITHRLAGYAPVDGAFGMAEIEFPVRPVDIEGEPVIFALPDAALQ